MRAAVGTAVVAGTATAVSGRVARRQEARMAAAQPEPAPAAAPPPPPPPPAYGPGPARDAAEQLRDLAELREQGAISEAEYEAAKRQVLGGGPA